MDGERFDGLAKAVVGGVSRRRLLAGLVGAAGGIGVRDRSRAEGRMAYTQCEPEFGCGPGLRQRITYEECEREGGMIRNWWSACHAYRQSGGVSCGAFQYHWENVCYIGGERITIDAGCAPCLL